MALTALEGSLRATYRLTVVKKGAKGAPSVAFGYPFAETPQAWVPIGLSDPDGAPGGQGNDLDVAMRRAVVNALDFLQHDPGHGPGDRVRLPVGGRGLRRLPGRRPHGGCARGDPEESLLTPKI
ncbi:hypothetical protein Aau02nite_07770 [Amorphoplanes auranticolor]|uniref:Uncharacterized protein n=1 Tax=Actinoplanes auranticolor TaxID=47988 RepID=A0A919S4E4_9ACTN|nr:hypothetical protein Aau02nite_07770 [Actinoplanes auranticolor]